MTDSAGALAGLKVIDLTMMLAGPYASMMLADQGASVIKVEPPGGDNTRRVGPHLAGALPQEEGGFGGYFASINRNKRSIVIDLKSDQGKAVLLDMIRQADVLIENYRLGVMDRLGLGYETLREINPRLVYASVRGFGDTRTGASPYADWPAYDPVAQSMGGIMAITGPEPGGAPTKIGPGVGDIIPAMFAAFGVVSACWNAQRTGQGQYVDVAMVDSILAICERIVFQYSATGEAPGVAGNGHPLLCPFGLFQARDGWVSLGVPNDKFWQRFTDLIGRPELADDPDFVTNEARLENHLRTNGLVADWCGARSRAEIAEILGGKVPFGPVFAADDVFGDPHFAARSMLEQVDQPGTDTKLTIAGTPVRMTGTPGGVRQRAPMMGEHTDAIMTEFGFDADRISQLRGTGIIA